MSDGREEREEQEQRRRWDQERDHDDAVDRERHKDFEGERRDSVRR
jgi:hypothetical protein